MVLVRGGAADQDLFELPFSFGVGDKHKAFFTLLPPFPSVQTLWAVPVPILLCAASLLVGFLGRAPNPFVWFGWAGFTFRA